MSNKKSVIVVSNFSVRKRLNGKKIGMLGDVQVGKTSLMVKYVENKFDEDYIQTLGIKFELALFYTKRCKLFR